jgi:hypothetical protein
MLTLSGVSAASKPGAPTIGTATATGATTATVSFTAPAIDGGAVIISYTATSSPGGITGTLSQAGSGTITVSGLSGSTSYTFTVVATNAAGTSDPSAASNSITTTPVIGSALAGGFFAGQISTTGNSVATHNLVIGPKSSAQAGTELSQKSPRSNDSVNTFSLINGPTNSANMNAPLWPAAYYCEGLTVGGYSDWYLPAISEQEVCYFNLKPSTTVNSYGTFQANQYAVPSRSGVPYTSEVPAQTSAANFQAGGSEAFETTYGGAVNPIYWSSTTADNSFPGGGFAYRTYFTNGVSGVAYKNFAHTIRAVRRVAL